MQQPSLDELKRVYAERVDQEYTANNELKNPANHINASVDELVSLWARHTAFATSRNILANALNDVMGEDAFRAYAGDLHRAYMAKYAATAGD